jgi:hypothetical protein
MPDFKGSADKLETFQLKSLILGACWLEKEAVIGGEATLEVRTLYVAHGAPISFTVKNLEGKTLEKIEGVVYADFFRKKIILAKDAAGGAFFEIELPKHGLRATGPRLNVRPRARVYEPIWKDMASGGSVSKVKRGMDLLVEAKTEGIAEGAEGRILFKERVSDTLVRNLAMVPCIVKDKKLSLAWRFEYPKDTSPLSSTTERRRTAETYLQPKVFFEAWSSGVTVAGPEADFLDSVSLEILDGNGKPAAGQKIKLLLPDGTSKETETDENGRVSIEESSPGQVKVEFTPMEQAGPSAPPSAPQAPAPEKKPAGHLKVAEALLIADGTETKLPQLPKVYTTTYVPGATILKVDSWEGLASLLQGYERIAHLVLFFHGTPGSLMIGNHLRGIDQFEKTVGGKRPRIGKIDFVACNVGEKPGLLAPFGKLFHATEVTAWNHFWVPCPINFPVSKSESLKSLEARLGRYNGYWIGKPPVASELAAKPGNHLLHAEWFREEYDEADLPAPPKPGDFDNRKKIYKPRSSAIDRICTAEEAEKLQAEYDSLPIKPLEHVIVRITG